MKFASRRIKPLLALALGLAQPVRAESAPATGDQANVASIAPASGGPDHPAAVPAPMKTAIIDLGGLFRGEWRPHGRISRAGSEAAA